MTFDKLQFKRSEIILDQMLYETKSTAHPYPWRTIGSNLTTLNYRSQLNARPVTHILFRVTYGKYATSDWNRLLPIISKLVPYIGCNQSDLSIIGACARSSLTISSRPYVFDIPFPECRTSCSSSHFLSRIPHPVFPANKDVSFSDSRFKYSARAFHLPCQRPSVVYLALMKHTSPTAYWPDIGVLLDVCGGTLQSSY